MLVSGIGMFKNECNRIDSHGYKSEKRLSNARGASLEYFEKGATSNISQAKRKGNSIFQKITNLVNKS